jgi:glycosyltransferase involved in cell wall biosynthesis
MMRTIFDISVLGSSHYYQKARTGIFRVTENLAACLKNSNECEVAFSASHAFNRFVQTLKYIESNVGFNQVPFCYPDSKLLKKFGTALMTIYPAPNTDVLYRTWQKSLSGILSGLTIFYRDLDHDVLSTADIFHSSFYPLPKPIKNFKGLRRFITIYDLIPILFPQHFEFRVNRLLRKILKSIDDDAWVVTISHSTKNDLCNYLKINPSKVFVTHLAASNIFYKCTASQTISIIRKKYNIPDAPYVLTLSTLEPRKNIDHTIRCFIKVIQEQHINDLHLVLVGTKGWDYNKIFTELTRNPKLKNRIIFTGYVPDEDLAPLYSGALMFVYPSIYEGFGLPPLEAMKCGVPVITSDSSSFPEVVGDAGIMVNPIDEDALCQSILELYTNSAFRSKVSYKSLKQSSLFSWEKCGQETTNAYKAALQGSE